MLALDDRQLQIIVDAAAILPVEKRSVFLERIAARLQLRGRPVDHFVFEDVVEAALRGLVHPSVG
jgi:hypothetical protein